MNAILDTNKTCSSGDPCPSNLAIKKFVQLTLGDHIGNEDMFLKEIEKYILVIEEDGAEAILDNYEYFSSKAL